jgi:large subunit ribosomal protein L29
VSKNAVQLEQFRDLPEEELRQQLATTRDELFRLQLGQYTNQVTSTAAVTGKRRDIARILTILRARELGTETQAQKSATSSTASEGAAEAAPARTKKKSTRKAKA